MTAKMERKLLQHFGVIQILFDLAESQKPALHKPQVKKWTGRWQSSYEF
jgi:hypothetical protein